MYKIIVYQTAPVWFVKNECFMAKIDVYRSLLASDRVIGGDIKMTSHPNSNAIFINIWDRLIWRRSPNLTRSSKLATAPNWLSPMHPVNSDAHLGEIVKMLSQELDIYIYIYLDNRYGFFYQFNLGFSQFLLMKSLNFFFFNFLKLAGLWLVGEVVAIYGSKVAEGFSAFQRRSCFKWF